MNMKQYRDTSLMVTKDGKVFGPKGLRKQHTGTHGYNSVGTKVNKISVPMLVHRMVAECYIPNPEGKPEVNHKDGDKSNNHISNLEWVTKSENNRHAYRSGLKNMKLKRKDIELAAYLRNECGWTWAEIGKEVGVSAEHISSVVRGRIRILTHE